MSDSPNSLLRRARMAAAILWGTTATRNAAYWRNAYETLVKQTGRDLNDGLGRDPRMPLSEKESRSMS